MINEQDFLPIVTKVIDNLEGGYFHPEMFKDGRPKFNALLATSGETMYGLDRLNGASALSGNESWGHFWAILDALDAKHKWKYNYMAHEYPELKTLTGQIMYEWFGKLYKKYITPETDTVINNDPGLIFHLAYGCWNGAGWFKRFSQLLNSSVEVGVIDIPSLRKAAIASRTQSANKLIRQTGLKIEKIINGMPL